MKRFACLIALVAALACSDHPTPGILKVVLTTPNSGGDAAMLLTVSGPGVLLSAAPVAGLRLFTQPLGVTNHIALTGTLGAGTILTIEVPDLAKASAYTATIQQVATPTYQLRGLTGYSLKVTP
jgi:hypothetical protein